MATPSAAPDLDAVDDAIRGISALMSEYVEPHMLRGGIAPAEEVAALLHRSDPIHYVRLLALAGGSIPRGSQAEGLWQVARALIATRSYCFRVDPFAAELREAVRAGADRNDPATQDAIKGRLRKANAEDDSAENKFLDALERLDVLSQEAQQATVDKLSRISLHPHLATPPELRDREVLFADIRALILAMLEAARSAIAVDDYTEFPRTRSEWNRTVSRLGARLKRLGFTHRQVASIFCGRQCWVEEGERRAPGRRAGAPKDITSQAGVRSP
jgi:hypothetical protein